MKQKKYKPEEIERLVNRKIGILVAAGRGAANAVTSDVLIHELGLDASADKRSKGNRMLRTLKDMALSKGVVICGSDKRGGGYFLPASQREAQKAFGRVRSAALTTLKRIAKATDIVTQLLPVGAAQHGG